MEAGWGLKGNREQGENWECWWKDVDIGEGTGIGH